MLNEYSQSLCNTSQFSFQIPILWSKSQSTHQSLNFTLQTRQKKILTVLKHPKERGRDSTVTTELKIKTWVFLQLQNWYIFTRFTLCDPFLKSHSKFRFWLDWCVFFKVCFLNLRSLVIWVYLVLICFCFFRFEV